MEGWVVVREEMEGVARGMVMAPVGLAALVVRVGLVPVYR